MAILRSMAVVALTLSFLAAPALAIGLGDEAPPLKIDKWVKGSPVDLKAGQGKNIYVVEFWATWCGPCRISVPHLTELQKKYKDKGVVIVGVSTDSEKTVADVVPFVEKMGDKMDYVVAIDKEQGTSAAYMEAFKQRGIPHAFVIDKQGRIVWHSHPDDLDKVLEELVGGKFDLEKAKKEIAERERLEQEREKAFEVLTRYLQVVSEKKDGEGSKEIADELMKMIDKDADLLNSLAWAILTDEAVQYRDRELALRAAKRAMELSKEENAAILDTYARALFDTGKKKEAIEYQKKAVKVAGDNEAMRKELEETLKKYEEAAGK